MTFGKGRGARGRVRLSRSEGSSRQRRNAGRSTTSDDLAPPLRYDENGRVTFDQVARVDPIANPATEGDHQLNALLAALQAAGIMED